MQCCSQVRALDILRRWSHHRIRFGCIFFIIIFCSCNLLQNVLEIILLNLLMVCSFKLSNIGPKFLKVAMFIIADYQHFMHNLPVHLGTLTIPFFKDVVPTVY
jgi:hypothetical protein